MLSERLLQLLTAYVDGGVTAHQRRVVLRYLRTSAEARSFLKKLQDDANELRQLPVRKLGRDLSQTILQRIGDQVVVRPIRIPMEQAPSPVPRGFGLATAAAVLLALGFGSVYYLKAIREKDALVAVAVVPPESSSNGLTPKDNKVTDSKIEVAKAPNPKAATPITVAKIDEKKQEQPPASSSIKDTGPVFTMPVPPPPDHFEIANVKVAMNLPSRDVLQENRRQQLLERLRKEDAQHIDLYCKQTRAALERVERAFKEQGIDFVLAPDAIQPYLFRSRNTDYVLFTESVKPEEVLTVLRQVADQDQALESTHKGKAQFQDVLVNAVSKRDHELLSKILGVEAGKLQPGKPTAPLGVDIRKPMALQTADAVVNSLQGKGAARRPQPGMTPAKPALKSTERLVVVGTCNPIHPTPESSEIKRFLEGRKQRGPDTMQMLMILRQGK